MLAKKGRKPKPSGLRIREGNREHMPIVPDPLAENQYPGDNNIEPPVKLSGRQLELWDQFIRKVPWLTWADVHTALLWVKMVSIIENKQKPSMSEIREMRTLSSLLGLDPSSRAVRMKDKDDKSVSKIGSLIGKAA